MSQKTSAFRRHNVRPDLFMLESTSQNDVSLLNYQLCMGGGPELGNKDAFSNVSILVLWSGYIVA